MRNPMKERIAGGGVALGVSPAIRWGSPLAGCLGTRRARRPRRQRKGCAEQSDSERRNSAQELAGG